MHKRYESAVCLHFVSAVCLQNMILGECENDNDCSSTQACFNFNCKDACQDACGISAQCKAINHGKNINLFNFFFSSICMYVFLGAICSCPDGYVGDALTACRPQRNAQPSFQNTRVIGLSRFKRDLNQYFTGFFY